MTVQIYTPTFDVDLSMVSTATGDLDLREAAEVVSLPRVNRAAVDLHRQAGAPAMVAYATTAGHLRALAGTFRAAGLRAIELDDGVDVAACRERVGELGRTLDVLVCGKKLIGSTPIPGLRAVLLARPTVRPEVHARYLGRLDRTLDAIVIVDLIGACRRYGIWSGAAPEWIVGASIDIVADPMVERLSEVPHKAALAWAGANVRRIELLQKVKNHRPGWCFHVIRATCGQVAAEEWWNTRRGLK